MPGRLKSLLLACALFLLNLYICRGLFSIEYLRHMGSIEGAFIGIARFVMTHWRDPAWFPMWYDGVPFQNVYPPLMYWCVAVVGLARGFSTAHAYHWVTGLAYCLGPVTLYCLALRMTRSRWTAFAAGAIYSLVSWSAWLIPAIARDLGSPLYPRRLQAMLYYGEGPHIFSLMLLPLGLLFLSLALERRRTPYFVLATLGLAAVPLTNWIGAFALAVLSLSYLLARAGSPGMSWRNGARDLAFAAASAVAAYCLALPWLPPSTVAVTQFNARTIGGDFTRLGETLPRWGIAILLVLAAIKWAIRRLEAHVQFAVFFAFLVSLLTLTAAWWNVPIVPQPVRYHLEMDMALSLLVVFSADAFLKRRERWIAAVVMVALLLALIQPLRFSRRYARNFLIRSIDITTTTEWKTAQWLKEHWGGERVMMPGSIAFWLTAFSDNPELGGGTDQATTDYMIRVALYGIYAGATAAGVHDGEYSILWLKALGVQAVGVSGPASGEVYKPFLNPKQFEGLLEPLRREGDDVIYRVGPPHASLARVIPRASIVARTPDHGVDVDPLRPYVAALDDSGMPHAQFTWTSGHSARINTDLRPEQVVSVQIAWHTGWHATVNGSPLPVNRDAIGLMVVDPGQAGPAVIDLIYDGGTEMRVANWLSALAALMLVGLAVRATLKKSW
jgi:hypothetical protein